MKICYIFSNMHLSHLTGQPGMVLKLIKKMSNKGIRVYIISNDQQRERQFVEGCVEYYLIKGLGDLRSYVKNIIKIVGYIRRIKPDLLHVQGHLLIIFIWVINRFLRIPMVCSICETLDKRIVNPFYRALIIYCLNRSAKACVSSEYVKSILTSNGVDQRKVILIRIGLDEKFLNNIEMNLPDTDVLYYGDCTRERGFDIIVGLAKRLPTLNFKVLLRWKSKDCDLELEEVKSLSNVVMLYYPYSEDLSRMLLKSKIIVLPYRWMAMRPPLSLIESLATGKCVVTSSLEGNEEIIKNNYNGMIIKFDDIDSVASKISLLTANVSRCRSLGEQAKKTIESMYSEEEYEKCFRIYTEINNSNNS